MAPKTASAAAGAELLYGDLVFLLGLPIPLRSLGAVALTAKLLAPIVTKLPIRWIYPTGSSQEAGVSGWRARYFERAEVIAGDFHLLKRYAPEELTGKVVLTNTTTAEDVELLSAAGSGGSSPPPPASKVEACRPTCSRRPS